MNCKMEFYKFAISVCAGVIILQVLKVYAEEQKKQRAITPCDEDISKILCNSFRSNMSACADIMPKEEHPFFFECAKKRWSLDDCSDWNTVLDTLCGQEKIVEEAYEIVDCWEEYMKEAVEDMDDNVYPVKHFECKENIFKDAVGKAQCHCQMEKGYMCSNVDSYNM